MASNNSGVSKGYSLHSEGSVRRGSSGGRGRGGDSPCRNGRHDGVSEEGGVGGSGRRTTPHTHNTPNGGRYHRRRRRKLSRHVSQGNKTDSSGGGRRRAGRSREMQSCSVMVEDEDGEATSDSSNALQIPGFYYDESQKRYFRILPGHNNASPGVVTNSSVKKATVETQRQQDLKHLSKSVKKSISPSQTHPQRIQVNRNTSKLLMDIQMGHIPGGGGLSERLFSRSTWLNLRPCGHQFIFPTPASPYEKLEHMNRMLLSRDQSNLLCLWTVAGLITQRIQMLDIKGLRCADEDRAMDIQLKPSGTVILQSLSKVTNICWAPVNSHSQDSHDNSILYTTTCFLGNSPSLAMLRNLDSTTAEGFRHTEFSLGPKATWTCAWNSYTKQFSVGSEKCGLLLDVDTRRLWELDTGQSDVLSQAFADQGSMLYSGTRKGQVLGHDLRSNSTRPTCHFPHPSSVCHVHLSNNSNFITSAQFNGKIQRWDLRTQKVVVSYTGNVNEYSRLPFSVDDKEQLLYTVGGDSYTRLWDYNTGGLLRSLPPPHEASRDTIPCVAYSDCVVNKLPSLLMGTRNQLHVFSL